MPLSTIFQLYRGVSVLLMEETRVTGENQRPTTVTESLTNFITKGCIQYTSPERDSNSRLW
jgi:hypothetical protein